MKSFTCKCSEKPCIGSRSSFHYLSRCNQPLQVSFFNCFAHKWIYKLVNSKLQRDNFYSLLSTILLNLLLFFKCVFFEDKVKHEFCNIKKNTTVLFIISSVASFHLGLDFNWISTFWLILFPTLSSSLRSRYLLLWDFCLLWDDSKMDSLFLA